MSCDENSDIPSCTFHDLQKAVIISLVAPLAISVFLFLLHKFCPLGSFIRRKKKTCKNRVYDLKSKEECNFLNITTMPKVN
ncbi:unnamed protein product [Plasmodium vivax]|uniref:(malaria parasite P. vivax) hypothetical protein n=1 Tax=Plasmodium vivax TaxID=5855 RepID=A0A8S4H4I8_PLAVI|nr:unnamed protein product [Plasmodium vivax]